MSKKQKRQISSGSGNSAPMAEKINASRITTTTTTEFNPDYTPVIKDLKRIGILAGSFIGLLVVLSFFLR